MIMRAVICKDDPTSHGGKVLEGNVHATVKGRQIAQRGHMTYCPQCKGNFPIAQGLGFHSFGGVGTAVEGMRTACGAVLMATTTRGFMMIDDRCGGGEAEPAETAAAAAAGAANAGAFRVVDDVTDEPLPGKAYRIVLPDGTSLRGVTDADGYTERAHGLDPATVEFHWENDEGSA